MKKHELLIGNLDTVLAQLTIINTTQKEMIDLATSNTSFMELWRSLGISVTTKTHLLEEYIV